MPSPRSPRARPDIAAAAAPLAEPAKSGVASRAVLRERLRALAGAIATAQPAPADRDWARRAWARLRGLVTIRRVDGAGQSAAEAAVSAAAAGAGGRRPAARGDGARQAHRSAAEAARPWLQMARQRLAADAALHRVRMRCSSRGSARSR